MRRSCAPAAAAAPAEPPADSDLRELLRERLLSLPFDAFAACCAELLTALGYRDVAVSRTDHAGHNREGGYDLMAALPIPGGGMSRRPVCVRLKQYPPDSPIARRAVDELRGVALRTGAAEALLITTSVFTPLLRSELLPASPVAPVRLIDGDGLLDLLLTYRIGVKRPRRGDGALVLDTTFFKRLELGSRGNRRPRSGAEDERAGCMQDTGRKEARLKVTICLFPGASAGPETRNARK
jgi:hypothetical protein